MTNLAELEELFSGGLPAPRGRRAKQLEVSKRRNLTGADIQQIRDAQPIGSEASPLKQLRHQHHLLARLLAEGRSQTEASFITGYSLSYISTTAGHDPAFRNLVQYYKDQTHEVFLNVHERLANLGISTVDELQDRLATQPESFSHRELMELAELTFDRGGYGPASTKNLNSTAGVLTPDVINRIRSEVALRTSGSVRQITPKDIESPGSKPLLEITLAEGQSQGSEGKRPDISAKSGEKT